jgi:hypothetical protein
MIASVSPFIHDTFSLVMRSRISWASSAHRTEEMMSEKTAEKIKTERFITDLLVLEKMWGKLVILP